MTDTMRDHWREKYNQACEELNEASLGTPNCLLSGLLGIELKISTVGCL